MPQTYNIQQTYQENYDRGPLIDFPFPEIPKTPLKEFLGLNVRSRLGIAAGLLLNSRWISAYGKLGFDLLTYKTVRSAYRPCYPLPNWVFVDDRGKTDGPVYSTTFNQAEPENAASAVCFGMPSMAPQIWRADIRAAKTSLSEGQALLVSVVATPGEKASAEEVAADFCRCAIWAAEAGADIVEANFSCPNVCSAEGTIYLDAALSNRIAGSIRNSIGTIPLLIKTGNFPSIEKMRAFLGAVTGVANGVTLVNCIVRPVLHSGGKPVFGEQFRSVGVAGRTIHKPAVAIVRTAVEIVNKDALGLAIIAVGGVSRAADIDDFFSAGASAVLMGSAPMYLPHLAVEAKRLHREW